jgi:hypothetical protein
MTFVPSERTEITGGGERRRAPRVSLCSPAASQLDEESAQLVNLSEGGVMLRARTSLQQDSVPLLRVQESPAGPSLRIWVYVVQSVPVRSAYETCVIVHAAFLSQLDASTVQAIRHWMTA